MPPATLTDLTLLEISGALARRETSSRDVTEAALAQIGATDDRVKAFLRVTADLARTAAKASDDRRSRNAALGPLDGVPIALKDLFVTEGIETTAGSKILQGFVPPYEGTPSGRLKSAGAVLLGKLNMDEFAMGSSTENSAYGNTHNPWDLARTPGGSSGGSSAAVAARQCFATLGTDTGGSIREPAAFCGVAGLKPTYGRVSRFGVVAFASSLDQVGPLARCVGDVAAVLQVIAGHDPRDSTSAPLPVPDYASGLEAGVKGTRLGIPKEYFVKGIDAQVETAVREAAKVYEKLGATLVEISLPHTEYAVATYYLVATAEASSNLARYDGVKYGLRADAKSLIEMYEKTRAAGFGAEVKRRIMLGTYALSSGYYDAYYLKAQKVRTLIRRDFLEAFKVCDAVLAPTAPTPAFKLGERVDDPLQMYLADIFTIPCNLAGLPGLSIPCGFTSSGLPMGMQVIGKAFDEPHVLRVARAYERETDWHRRKPAIA